MQVHTLKAGNFQACGLQNSKGAEEGREGASKATTAIPCLGQSPRASMTVMDRLERCSSLECLAMILAAMPS